MAAASHWCHTGQNATKLVARSRVKVCSRGGVLLGGQSSAVTSSFFRLQTTSLSNVGLIFVSSCVSNNGQLLFKYEFSLEINNKMSQNAAFPALSMGARQHKIAMFLAKHCLSAMPAQSGRRCCFKGRKCPALTCASCLSEFK